MTNLHISLPQSLKSFVDQQVEQRGYATSSEYIRELIRKDQERVTLRQVLLEGATSALDGEADPTYFEHLRQRDLPGWLLDTE